MGRPPPQGPADPPGRESPVGTACPDRAEHGGLSRLGCPPQAGPWPRAAVVAGRCSRHFLVGQRALPALRRLAIGQFQSGEGDGHELGGVFRRAGGPLLPQFLQPGAMVRRGTPNRLPIARPEWPASASRAIWGSRADLDGRGGAVRSPSSAVRGLAAQGAAGRRRGRFAGILGSGFQLTVDMAVSWENGLSTRSYNQLSISLNSCQEASRGFFRDSGCTARSDRRKCVRCHTLLRRNATENFRRERGKCRCARGLRARRTAEQRAAISCAAST